MSPVLQPFHDSITAELSALRQEIRSISTELDTSGSSTTGARLPEVWGAESAGYYAPNQCRECRVCAGSAGSVQGVQGVRVQVVQAGVRGVGV